MMWKHARVKFLAKYAPLPPVITPIRHMETAHRIRRGILIPLDVALVAKYKIRHMVLDRHPGGYDVD